MTMRGFHSDPVYGPTNPEAGVDEVRRLGSVIELAPEQEKRYRQLHADVWPGVLARLHRSCIRNYSIFIAPIGGKTYLFSYFEYFGSDLAEDMAKIAADSTTRKWWVHTDPCQMRLPGTPDGEQWLPLESVFFARLTGLANLAS